MANTVQLRDALQQISDIRRQMARSEVFRGYRAATIACSGLLGILAAVVQPLWVPAPESDLVSYLSLWIGVAAICLGMEGVEMCWRMKTAGPGHLRELTRLAIEQFAPCVVVGGLLTVCIVRGAPQVAWMLPGLWSLIFGLGVFASYRLLPRPVFWVGCYYVLCGCGCLIWGQGSRAYSPWQMVVCFGGGQLLAATILYWTLERADGTTASE